MPTLSGALPNDAARIISTDSLKPPDSDYFPKTRPPHNDRTSLEERSVRLGISNRKQRPPQFGLEGGKAQQHLYWQRHARVEYAESANAQFCHSGSLPAHSTLVPRACDHARRCGWANFRSNTMCPRSQATYKGTKILRGRGGLSLTTFGDDSSPSPP